MNDETVGGYRYGKGVLARFDTETEAELLATADAENYPRPILISQAYSPVTRTSENSSADTNYVTLASVTVPGGTMNYNGRIVVEQDWKYTNSVSAKTLQSIAGRTWVAGPTVTTSTMACFMIGIKDPDSVIPNCFVVVVSPSALQPPVAAALQGELGYHHEHANQLTVVAAAIYSHRYSIVVRRSDWLCSLAGRRSPRNGLSGE